MVDNVALHGEENREQYLSLAIGALDELDENSDDFMIQALKSPRVSAVKIWKLTIMNAFPGIEQIGNSVNLGCEETSKYLLRYTLGAAGAKQYLWKPAELAQVMTGKPELVRETGRLIVENLIEPMNNKGNQSGTGGGGSGNSRKGQAQFRKKVMERDKFRCVVTKRPDRGLKGLLDGSLPVTLEAAHIIPHTIAKNKKAISFIEIFSADTITAEDLEEGCNGIDNPYNGIPLQADAHQDFDRFLWGIDVEEEVDNDAMGPGTVYKTIYKAKRINLAAPGPSFEIPNEGIVLQFGGDKTTRPRPEFCKLHFAVGCIIAAIGGVDILDIPENDGA